MNFEQKNNENYISSKSGDFAQQGFNRRVRYYFTVNNIGTFFRYPYVFGCQNLSSNVEYRCLLEPILQDKLKTIWLTGIKN